MFCFREWALFRGKYAVVAHEVWWLGYLAQKQILITQKISVLLNADSGMTPTPHIAHQAVQIGRASST
jgi:hypothetical protein